jgi:hypothetical protein
MGHFAVPNFSPLALRLARNTIKMTNDVLGVVVLVRNGDRIEYYQDPENYSGAYTQTTALGEVIHPSLTLIRMTILTLT